MSDDERIIRHLISCNLCHRQVMAETLELANHTALEHGWILNCREKWPERLVYVVCGSCAERLDEPE